MALWNEPSEFITEIPVTASQTDFVSNYPFYGIGNVQVFHNGLRLRPGEHFTAVNNTTIRLTTAVSKGNIIIAVPNAT